MQNRFDNIFADAGAPETFTFNKAVARVFPDMIKRSVPGYSNLIPLIEIIARSFGQNNSYAYDLGCSVGASTLAIRHGIEHLEGCRIFAVDTASSMLEHCAHYIELDNAKTSVELLNKDIRALAIENASLVVLNFTLQFVPQDERDQLMTNIFNGLLEGGCVILSEKLASEEPQEQTLFNTLHEEYKRANGYSELEISRKRSALENVLVTETEAGHVKRLEACGFINVTQWYRCFQFASFVAFKS